VLPLRSDSRLWTPCKNVLDTEANDRNEAARWLTRLASLKESVKKTRTVIGILGNTGAGKSSLINALLDEESLIPTNCMRACTAVPTEISYNHHEDADRAYRGDVEFVSMEDWKKEVSILLAELVDPNRKLSKDYLQADTGAGIAYAKIKAVYPQLSNDQLAKSTVKDLLEDSAVQNVLGTVRSHSTATARRLKVELQPYLDSAEKSGSGSRTDIELAYWPLVKVVRIYVKSKVLSTGTVLVDLPGVQDSNAARSAVAERFMTECSAIWIVSPINRAVDDKAAKHLLGSSFRLQLTMDGNYSNVTFICSKTDEISVREVAEKLDYDGSIRQMWARGESIGRKLAQMKHQAQELNDQREELDDLRDELEQQASKKRKHDASQEHQENPTTSGQQVGDDGELSEAARVAKDVVTIRKRLKDLRTEMRNLQAERQELDIEATARCVEARNKYSSDAIRKDFAQGVKETVEDAEAQQDDGLIPPAAERDYDEIAKTLPVFCVSSRGYQFLKGRSSKDSTIDAYRCPEDTQIPQLQEHAMRLGDVELGATNKAFIAGLVRYMRSLLLWTSNTGTAEGPEADKLTETELAMVNRLETLLAALGSEFDNCIKSAVTVMRAGVQHQLVEPISSMCYTAASQLPEIARGWPRQGHDGRDMRWATYRSICLHK
jgi:GTPase SAR1 family protein